MTRLYTKLGTMPGLYYTWWGNKLPVVGKRGKVRLLAGDKWIPVYVDKVEDWGDQYAIFCSMI